MPGLWIVAGFLGLPVPGLWAVVFFLIFPVVGFFFISLLVWLGPCRWAFGFIWLFRCFLFRGVAPFLLFFFFLDN